MSHVVMARQCPYCGKSCAPSEICPVGQGGAWMCLECNVRQQNAMDALASGWPKDCTDCGLSFEERARQQRTGDIKLYPHWKDGVLQVLCEHEYLLHCFQQQTFRLLLSKLQQHSVVLVIQT